MASSTLPWLTLSIFVPIFFGLLVLLVGRDDNPGPARVLSLVGSIISFLVTLPLYTGFNPRTADMQFVENTPWIEAFNLNYHLGIDGISVWFVLLTAFITIIVVLAGWEVIKSRVAQYMAAFLILSGLMVGVFCALDGMLFYVFFEATLIPMYIIIGAWGGPNRVYAAFKFFLYTLLGSLLTLIAFIYLWHVSGQSFDIATWHQVRLSYTEQMFIFVALFAAFAVKIPMWPIHTWLPDAHVEAPTGGSIVLAAIMLKLGAYAFLRFSLPIAPDASHSLAGIMIALSLVAVIYIGLVAIVQDDMKKLVAYSSVAHMGFVTLGFFVFNITGLEGAIIQMISHGFVSGAMFMCIGVMYDRLHTRRIDAYGGIVNRMPRFVTYFVLFSMANAGLPGTSGFVGEFTVILGAVQYNFWIGLLAASALIWGAGYSLWMVKRVAFGPVVNEQVNGMQDLCRREFLILGLLAILTLFMGIYPSFFTDLMHPSVQALLDHVAQSKL
ncbi:MULTISPECIES: NADH-quinone oxidoreductase subunit M [unclassified Castellaniella]|uniref:NADH-quinone oxidoreductase subunit M n=1 Tax=unclassified Castellaniella TaxID=2617606 RepID=UPI003314D348